MTVDVRPYGLALLLVVLPALAVGQSDDRAVLSGTVHNRETGEPLANVNVFIAGSMIGTATDAAGYFRLHVPLGAHTLYVSHVGFESAQVDTLLYEPETHRFEFRLMPVVIELPELAVGPDRDDEWYEDLEKFERLFIGETDNARQCSLLNPEVLRFESRWWGKLTAEASRPLIVENRALGYRIRYFLEEFTYTGGELRFHGEPMFEELAPADSQEMKRWQADRRRAYRGSVEHFLQSAVRHRVEEAGFRTYIQPNAREGALTGRRVPYDAKHLLEPGDHPEERRLTVPWVVQVIYRGEEESRAYLEWQDFTRAPNPFQRSWFELTDGPVVVDHRGEVAEPYGITVYGHFAFERMANALPKEYRPDSSSVAAAGK